MSLFAALCLVFALQDASSPLAGRWTGEIVTPNGPLSVEVRLEPGDGDWSGSIDIPQQGARGLVLEGIEVQGNRVRFVISGIPGTPCFEGTREGEFIRGTFSQADSRLAFELARAGGAEPGHRPAAMPNRPQEPKRPYPYREEEVSYRNGAITLAGTLTIPRGPGPFPAVLLITGSGAQNRDEEIVGHKPFLVIADHLTRHGIAVLRVDDRGVGGSTGNTGQSTSEDFAGDVLAGVAFLQEHDGIFEDAVGVLGHSEGGLVGPLAASRSERIAFVIMLAGPGVPGEEILYCQSELIGRANGAGDEAVAAQRATQERLFALMKSEPDDKRLAEKARAIIEEQIEALATTGAQAVDSSVTEADAPAAPRVDAQIESQVRQLVNPWMRFFLTYDPRTALRKVRVPVLVLNGEKDLQVWHEQNLPEIRKALQEAGNDDVTIKALPGLNHLFQHSPTGSPNEYARIAETISPEVLDLITDWILDRF